jgi:hypothetical protein
MTEFLTLFVMPLSFVVLGLIIEYWIIQPMKETKADHTTRVPLRFLWLAIVVLLLPILLIYQVWISPCLVDFNRNSYHHSVEWSVSPLHSSSQSLNITLDIPKYIYGSEQKWVSLEITNPTITPTLDISAQLVIRNEDSLAVPLSSDDKTLSEEKSSFQVIAPESMVQGKIPFSLEVSSQRYSAEVGIYQEGQRVDKSPRFEIQASRWFGLVSMFMENVLLSSWANGLIVILVVLACLLAGMDKQPETDRGALFVGRIVVRATGTCLVVSGIVIALIGGIIIGLVVLGIGVLTIFCSGQITIATDLHIKPLLLAIWKFLSAPRHSFSSHIGNLIPRAMIGVLPLGIVLGLVVGSLVFAFPSSRVPSMLMPSWLASLFGYPHLALTRYEFDGVLVGTVICAVCAIAISGHLSAALALGFGLGFPAFILLADWWRHEGGITFFGHLLWFLGVGILFLVIEPGVRRIRNALGKSKANDATSP